VISEELGKKLDSVEVEDCGRADKVSSDKENTSIIGGRGDKKSIVARVAQIKTQIAESTSDFDSEKLQERLAKLSGGVAVINVGAATEVELKDKKERVIDAVAATKAALEEGIVPGGAVALLNIAQNLSSKAFEKSGANKDEMIGYEIVRSAIEEPFKMLMKNAGLNSGELIAKARTVSAKGFGFDVLKTESVDTAEPIDMIKAGIIDPLKVVRTAVQNAISVATMILTTEALSVPQEK
jgi:chaperonin GroEL